MTGVISFRMITEMRLRIGTRWQMVCGGAEAGTEYKQGRAIPNLPTGRG